ncbi:uncharacterized protein K02A2.6-like [Saccostrea cucullata]|uniref:uncharacterized protein K02A2.6-like n=1 Tax=Saccostrea cuccullata TaxID=36930 RepID=UPI002ED16B5A
MKCYCHQRQNIYGKEVTVQTDHKPLVSIIQKPIHSAPARLQRMILQLQRYSLHLTHVPGKKIPVADTLSRKYLPDTLPSISDDLEAQVHMISNSIPMSDACLDRIRYETAQDSQLVTLTSIILNGWPEHLAQCPYSVREFWNIRDELSVVDKLVMKGQRIVIPRSLQSEMLEKLHTGHPGVERTLRRARDSMFWPGISQQARDMTLTCPTCLTHRNSKPKEPLKLTDVPDYPWQVVATDLFTWDDQDFLIVVDYYSRFFEVFKLKSTTSQSVITKLQESFSRHGIPEKVVSDNGPQYSSHEFKDFAHQWNFNHTTSSPRYPQSNGLAERTVQTAKRMLTKSKKDGRNLFLSILAYRTTPLNIGLSPSQLLMSRRLRSDLPVHPSLLKPHVHNQVDVRHSMMNEKVKSKQYYDKRSRLSTPLDTGDKVRVQLHSKTWTPAVVLKPNNERSYLVKTPNGSVYSRNSRHIVMSNENVHCDHENPNFTLFAPQPTTQGDTLNMQGEKLDTDSTRPTYSPGVQSNHDKHMPVQSNMPYVTRSGRIVKPIDKLNL